MTKLSVNVNKIATLRNARGGDVPNVCKVAQDCERYGADGITIHPRPDERHITTQDVYDLKKVVQTEYNIEGNPNARFMRLVEETRPTQATLVPDSPAVLTSNQGWDTLQHKEKLTSICKQLKDWGIRTSLFIAPDMAQIEGAKAVGADRIELYTGPFADEYENNKIKAVESYALAAAHATKIGLGVNAGHDLSLANLTYFKVALPNLAEVSIGHALISEALYLGLEETIQRYLKILH